ncbi:ComF family protein [Deltaproteobacteria bacterium IMCC39524]|nr:ComF family protein [Deltaproteobacteria bacterium IMCC39524]
MWVNLRRALSAGIDLFLPPACLLCGQLLPPGFDPQEFCAECQASMPPLGRSHCSCCSQPFPASSSQHLCATCLQRPAAFSTVHAACSYQERVKDAIHQLKYRNQVNLAEPLGKLLGKSLEVAEVGFKPECIIPVPLHPGRLKKRGYNQALEISRPLARKMQVPIDTTLLQRTLKTPPQQGLTAAERRSNLRNAFIVTTTPSARNILLVDDVMTTGETVRECSRVLMKNNIAEVQVAVIGRA